ncbi:acetate--CoA ligase [Candidatus Roizmanbacteria bacterium]|nr:acetate--CoA ligase [Candidatus Roizmanbacteria bacterium]
MINPTPEIIEGSYVKDYEALALEVAKNPEEFWGKIAQELGWYKPWDKVLDWQYPYAHWFKGAQCNIVHNALDRHLLTPVKDKVALIWEGQNGLVRKYTYSQLNDEVSRFANGLKSIGVKKGDHVSIYLPRIPEQNIAMLACAKIGAVHSVVFSGFSVEALKSRVIDAESQYLVTTDCYPYKDKVIDCKIKADEAIKDLPQVKKMVVVKHTDVTITAPPCTMQPGRDIWWFDLTHSQNSVCETEVMEATDPLFILYTSGSTGKPKGVIHSHGGYMVGIYLTLKWVFNLQSDDVYFCTADAGWITGHSYIVYSPLINGITTFVYESVPDYPDPGKWWSLVEKYKVTKFYTAPTAVRALMRMGGQWPQKYNLTSLKILGSVGEPINPEAWLWYHEFVGGKRCPIMDTWWQTETGMFMLTPVPSVPLKPGSAFKPFIGIDADVVNDKGVPVAPNTQGFLVIKKPWPSMFADVYKNPQKYKEAYWEVIPNVYFTGDSAKKDEDGYFWIIGRNDDVIKVSGHRLGSAEIESAFVSHPSVAEAAAIGKPHEIKGESIKVFVILKHGKEPSDELKKELVQQVRTMIGPIATPDEIDFVDKLPKTRSGKIMRRVLKAQELGLPVGDTSTLEN